MIGASATRSAVYSATSSRGHGNDQAPPATLSTPSTVRADDECQLFVWPALVGGGKPSLPSDTQAQLELLDERRFSNGVVYLRDATRAEPRSFRACRRQRHDVRLDPFDAVRG